MTIWHCPYGCKRNKQCTYLYKIIFTPKVLTWPWGHTERWPSCTLSTTQVHCLRNDHQFVSWLLAPSVRRLCRSLDQSRAKATLAEYFILATGSVYLYVLVKEISDNCPLTFSNRTQVTNYNLNLSFYIRWFEQWHENQNRYIHYLCEVAKVKWSSKLQEAANIQKAQR